MKNQDIVRALTALRPGAQWTLSGDDLSALVWHDEAQARPSDDDILTRAAQPPGPTFLARDLLAQLTTDDYAAITAAVAGSAPLGLLWASLLGQGDAPIATDSARFQQGWAGLTAALGQQRAGEIATALGLG